MGTPFQVAEIGSFEKAADQYGAAAQDLEDTLRIMYHSFWAPSTLITFTESELPELAKLLAHDGFRAWDEHALMVLFPPSKQRDEISLKHLFLNYDDVAPSASTAQVASSSAYVGTLHPKP